MRERYTLSNGYVARLVRLTAASKPRKSANGSLILGTIKVLNTLSAGHTVVKSTSSLCIKGASSVEPRSSTSSSVYRCERFENDRAGFLLPRPSDRNGM